MRRSSRSQLTFDFLSPGAADRWLALLAVAEHLEANQLIDIMRGQRCLIELHAELFHANRSDGDHGGGVSPNAPDNNEVR